MVARKGYGGLVFVLATCLATVYVFSRTPARPVALFSQADLNIIDTAENMDDTPQGLAMKNDDGHTRMWNAANSKHTTVVKAAKAPRQAVDNYGMPRFYVHATGWVDDIGPNAKAPDSGALASHGTTSLLSKESITDIDKWETAMLRSSYPDSDANPKQAALAASREARLARGLKKMAQLAKTQKLWNAAVNDEITANNVGHVHPSEMTELQKMSPEYHEARTHAHVTSATEMSYHPLRWIQQQRAPAVTPRKAHTSKLAQATTVAKKSARLQQLWNAAADDEIGGDPSIDNKGGKQMEYHPMKWIAEQRDSAELGSEYAPRDRSGRVFQENRNHVRNFEGSYVNDNSIGIKVDALKGRTTMLDEAAPATEEAPNENEETIKMLDDLRNLAMGAYDSMPDGTPDIMKAMVKADYEKVMEYLEEVRNQAIGQSNGQPAAAKAGTTSLAAVKKLGLYKVAQALTAGVGKPLTALKAGLKQLDADKAEHDGQRQALVAKSLSDACDSAAEILAEPKYASFEAARTAKVA